jgi:hypothetical protein
MINAEIFAKARRLGYTTAWIGVTHKPRTAGCQTGAQPKVILKAVKEFWSLWREIKYGSK